MSRVCGIVSVAQSGQVDPKNLDTLIGALRHDISYQSTSYHCPTGAAYLARIIYPGSESFSSVYDGDDLVCVVTGYVANLKEICKDLHLVGGPGSDISTPGHVVASLLRDRDLAAFERFNGLWAFAAWDRRHHRLYLGADRYGIRPIYYRQVNDQVLFGSEVKAISHSATDLTIDLAAVEDLLVLGMITGDRTVYAQIQRVPAATVVQFDQHGRLEYRYWWFDRLQIDPTLAVPEFFEENRRLFARSIDRLLPYAPRAISMLSSGFDSRRIVLELRPQVAMRTYTSSVQMHGQKFETDSLIARALCADLALPNISVDLYDPVIEPELTRVAATLLDSETNQHRWILPLLQRIPVGAGVNFDGLGGDVLLFGKQVVLDVDRWELDKGILPNSIRAEFGPSLSAYLRRASETQPIADRIRAQVDLIPPSPYQISHWFIWQWTRRRTSQFGQGLLGLKMESVYPFMDNDYVELCYRLSPEYKLNRNLQEEILRMQYPELMSRIPSSHYPAIGTAPDDHCRPYVRPIPSDYAPRRRYHSSLATARAITGTPTLLSRLSPACLAVALGVRLIGRALPATSPFIERSWRLGPLAPILKVHQTINDRHRQEAELAAARHFVFGENV